MPPYRVVLYCSDCTGEDPDGCFDGGTEALEETFTDLELAHEAGWKATHDVGPWGYVIEDVETKEEIFDSHA